ncbi:circadian clock protein KaiC [Flaviaesturariibacter flavus]|uniref:non-specific serine/threonine protein kinase n=1 Tax=Flaviaesturariibacter flavus TaxID=2502780 RepID=A0A4R1BIK5_9BACT|nr:circadian clock protein KaiC [Flaviaesturariibacter flavus]TCJ17084.1 circadian clock protein KaiC [Flaviaesturariibacter flavus]
MTRKTVKAPARRPAPLHKVPTGIDGFDEIAYGGLPRGRATLLSGSSGSGKTIFATQFLYEGALAGEPGVFVTFEEVATDLKRNVRSFGWDIEALEKKELWRYVDASTPFENDTRILGDYNLEGLTLRVLDVVRTIGARRVVLDSIGSLFHYLQDPNTIRHELHKLLTQLKKKNLAIILTSERLEEYGNVSRFGVEEYLADNVLILRNVLESEKRRRTIEILKYRGSAHSAGEQPFVIHAESGLRVIPLTRLALTQQSSEARVSSGNAPLDAMCGGGFFKDSIVLVSGATGTGKTLMVTEFIKGGYESGERVLFLAYEESRAQLGRNAAGWGVDFGKMERSGRLHIEVLYPETMPLEEHLVHIQGLVEKYKPARFALDSLSAIERGSSKKNFREFLIALTSFLKKKEIMAIFTSTSANIIGGTSVTDSHISTITDTIILLRYAELRGRIYRVVTVLKMRGSRHTKSIYEFDIDSSGMHISDSEFSRISGILGGMPMPAGNENDEQD